jgi:hypothetical protein
MPRQESVADWYFGPTSALRTVADEGRAAGAPISVERGFASEKGAWM